jgi:precorrin-2 methylase
MTGHMYLAFTKLGDILLFETYFNILSLIGFGL